MKEKWIFPIEALLSYLGWMGWVPLRALKTSKNGSKFFN